MPGSSVKYDIIATDHASKTFEKIGRSSANLHKHMGKVGAAFKAAAVAGAGGMGALAAVAGKSISAYSDFNAVMRQVSIQTGATTKPLENLAIQMGQKTAYSAKQAGDAMLELAKSGMSSAQIQSGGLASTLKLAQAGGVELADAAGYMTNSMQSFGIKAKDANKVVTALAGGANASTASVESLGLGLAQSAAGARNAGLTLNDTVSVLSAFDNAGIKGSDAGTSLKTMLQRLIPSTKSAKAEMHKLGLNFVDAHGHFLKVTQIAQELHDKLGPLTQAQKAQALQTIFGSDATRAATILMRNGAGGINKYEKATRNSAVANKLANSRMQGLSGAIENMKGSMETLSIVLGRALAPMVTKVASFISGRVLPAVTSFIGYVQGHWPVIQKVITRAWAAIEPALTRLGAVLWQTIQPLLASTASTVQHQLWPALKSLAGIVARNVVPALKSVTGFVQRNQTLIRTLAVAVLAGAGAFQTFRTVTGIVKGVTGGVKGLTASMKVMRLAMATNPVGAVVVGLAALASGLIYAYKHSETFRRIVNGAFRAVKSATVAVIDWFRSDFIGFFTRKIPGAFNTVVGWLRKHWRGITQLILAPLFPLPVLIWRYWGPISRTVTRGVNDIVGFFTKLPGRVTRALSSLGSSIASPFVAGYRWARSRITGGIDNIVNFYSRLPGRILRALAGFGRLLVGRGKALIQGLWSGMRAVLGTPYTWVKDHIFDPIAGAIKSLFHISSPSKVMHGLGGHVIDGFLRGILSRNPKKVVSGIFADVLGGLAKYTGKAVSGIEGLIGGSVSSSNPFGLLGRLTGLGGGSGGPSVATIQNAMKKLLPHYGWSGDQFRYWDLLERGEAGYNPNAQNPSSSAFGLGQFLDSTWATVGLKKSSNWLLQIDGMARYIKTKYGSPELALLSWMGRSPHWYAGGTKGAAPGWAVVGERGPELVRMRGGEQVLNNRQTKMAGYAGGTDPKLLERIGAALLRNVIPGIGGHSSVQGLADRFAIIRKKITANFTDPLRSRLVAYTRDVNKALDGLARDRDRIAARIQAANQMAAGVKSGAMGGADITQLGTATPKATIVAFRKKMRQIMNFNYYLKRLSQRGLARGILQDLINAGPEAAPFAQQLLHMSKAQIGQLNSIQYRTNKAAAHLGTTAVNISMGGSASRNYIAGLKGQQRLDERDMDRMADAIGAAVAHYMEGAKLRVDGRGIAHLVNTENLRRPRVSRS